MEKMSKNGVKAKNQLIDFIGLSKRHFCQKWLKIQIGEGIDAMHDDEITAYAAGCSGYVAKPFSPRVLLATIHNSLP